MPQKFTDYLKENEQDLSIQEKINLLKEIGFDDEEISTKNNAIYLLKNSSDVDREQYVELMTFMSLTKPQHFYYSNNKFSFKY